MINKKTLADFGTWMNLDSSEKAANIGNKFTQKRYMMPVTPVCHTMVDQNVKPRIQQNNLPDSSGCWIPFGN